MNKTNCPKNQSVLFCSWLSLSLVLQASSAYRHQWDWAAIKATRDSGQPFSFGEYSIVDFTYAKPDAPNDMYRGFEINKNGKFCYMEIDDSPATANSSPWVLLKSPDGTPTFDIDNDGILEVAVATSNEKSSSLRIFSLTDDVKLRGAVNEVPNQFELLDVGAERPPRITVFGDPLDTASSTRPGLVKVTRGGIAFEDSARTRDEIALLNNARSCVRSWRLGDVWNSTSREAVRWREECQRWLSKNPNDAKMLAFNAAIYSIEYPIKMDEATTEANNALKIDPNCALANAVMAHISDIKQKYTDSAGYFSKAIAAQPENPEWYAGRGLAYEGAEQFDKAIEDYSKVIELDPKSDWALGSRAHAYQAKNDLEPALKDINHLLAINSKSVYGLKQRADLYRKMKKFAEALADLKTAEQYLATSSPDLVEVLDMQASAYEELGQKSKSKAARKRVDALCKKINGEAEKSK